MIGFAGLSHLGLVSAIAAASKGFDVVGFDTDGVLVAAIDRGDLPVFEPGLAELFDENRGRLRFTGDSAELSACDLVVFARDVATDDRGESDLGPLRALINAVVPHIRPGSVPVVLSQVPPGFTRGLGREPASGAAGRPLEWYYQVETLIFGRAVERALRPERFIVGCADPAGPLPPAFRRFLEAFDCPILPMRYESAELTKIAINMCLVSSVSVANTLAELCEAIGADWAEMVPALKLDQRIGQSAYLAAGLGLSGGNLERDLATVRGLSRRYGTDAGVVDAWLVNSAHRRDWALRRLHSEVLACTADPVVAIWGLAYKPDTHSTKNSPALALLDALGPLAARVHDPQVVLGPREGGRVVQVHDPLEACRGADALVVATPWPAYAAIDHRAIRVALRGRVVIDPFGALSLAGTGLVHHRLGRPVLVEESPA
jgi:UDPglucose 6-dehydrogenase